MGEQKAVSMALMITEDVKEAIIRALESTTYRIVEQQGELIEQQLTPSGKPQKQNSAKWAKIKQKKLGHTTPLKAFEEVLINPDNYKVEFFDDVGEFGYLIYPPESRALVIMQLRDLEYELFEIPEGSEEMLENNVALEVNL